MANIPERFEQFHRDNPHVYDILVRLAREWVTTTGRHKIGIATLYERVRWEIATTTSDADYKLNDAYRAYYARLIMLFEKDLSEIFEVRDSGADQWLEDWIGRIRDEG